MKTIDYAARAKLFVIPRVDGLMNGQMVRGGAVYDGTFAGAVKRFMSLGEDEYGHASIGFDVGTIEDDARGLIKEKEIKLIFARSDFPH